MSRVDQFDFSGMAETAAQEAETFREDRALARAHQLAAYAIVADHFHDEMQQGHAEDLEARKHQEAQLEKYDQRLERLMSAFNLEFALKLFDENISGYLDRSSSDSTRMPSADPHLSEDRLDDLIAYANPISYVRSNDTWSSDYFGTSTEVTKYSDGSSKLKRGRKRDVPVWVIGSREVSPTTRQYLGAFPRELIVGQVTTVMGRPKMAEETWPGANDTPSKDYLDRNIQLLDPPRAHSHLTLDGTTNRNQNATKDWCVIGFTTNQEVKGLALSPDNFRDYYNKYSGKYRYSLYRPPVKNKQSDAPVIWNIDTKNLLTDDEVESYDVFRHLARISGAYRCTDQFADLGKQYLACRESANTLYESSLQQMRVNGNIPDFIAEKLKTLEENKT